LRANRLGRGKGYYDKFLSEIKPTTKKIGVAFDVQVVDSLPVDKHDIALDYIFTEKKVIKAK